MSVMCDSIVVKGVVEMNGLASEKQMSFLSRLYAERAFVGEKPALEGLSSREASQQIEALLQLPMRMVEVGIYQVESGDVYRVQPSQQSGRLYAKKLLFSGGWEYESGAIFRLKPEQKMSKEQAKAFGLAYGLCCVCGRFLSDPASVAEGIGPVCVKKVRW